MVKEMLGNSAMEDQFANILQRNYGLKAVGKSPSHGSRSDERSFGRALERGKSVGSGRGRVNQSAAAAILLAGDNLGTLSKSARQADPHWTYGSAPDQGFRGSVKSGSVGGHGEIYGGPRSGSASSASFADFLEGKVTGGSADRPFNEDVPVVFSQTVSRPTEQSSQRRNERDAPEEWVGRRPSRAGESRQSTEEEFLESLTGELKTSSEAGSAPSSYDGPRSVPLKSGPSAESDSPLKGSFMRGFGWSKTAMPAPQLSPGRSGDPPWERSAGEGSNGLTRRARASSAASSVSVDVSEAECVGRPDSVSGFTIPASNGTPFPDLNEPYAPSSTDSPTERVSQPKVSSSEPDPGETLHKSAEKVSECPETPKTPVAASAEQKDSPRSGPGPFAAESGSHASSQGVSAEEGVPMRKTLDVNAMGNPSVSSSHAHRSRKSTRTSDAVNRGNGSASSLDEPVTKFEASIGAGGGSHRGRRKSDSSADGWLTVDQIRLVTEPSSFPPPTRPPPPPPSHGRRYSGADGRRGGQKSESSGTTKDRSSQGPEESESEKQRCSPNSEVSSMDKLPSSQKVQQSADMQGTQSPAREEVVGNEMANGGVAKQAEKQKSGYVLPEVTVVDLGAEEMKPSREERRRTREQIERERRRAKREEERVKEKERVQQEVARESMFADSRREKALEPRDLGSNDTDTSGGREGARPRMGRREKVFDPRERHFQETASRREEKDIQYRNLRQQEKELQARLARQDARERENERSGDKLRRSAEKAALEAHERAERAAVERAVQEAHERAERAARQRAAAAREKERVKEKEREREREREKERDREEEKLRDRLREKERGLGEQFRSRDSFRATSEPRHRPAVAAVPPSGLSRFNSGGNLSNLSVAAETRNSGSVQKGVDDGTNVHFQEIPGEPADRRTLRLEKQLLIEERSAKALKERNMRDQALQREQEERQRLAGGVDADVRRWSTGKEGNLRALLSTLHMMLWPECNWKVVSLSDLVAGPAVKKAYQRAILCVHPDKVQQKGANVKQKYIAEKVFDLLKDAYAKFNSELY